MSIVPSEPRTITARDALDRITHAIRDTVHPERAQYAGLDPFDALDVIANVAAEADRAMTDAMAEANRSGATLQQIGDHLGISRQAVWNRLDRADLLAPR